MDPEQEGEAPACGVEPRSSLQPDATAVEEAATEPLPLLALPENIIHSTVLALGVHNATNLRGANARLRAAVNAAVKRAQLRLKKDDVEAFCSLPVFQRFPVLEDLIVEREETDAPNKAPGAPKHWPKAQDDVLLRRLRAALGEQAPRLKLLSVVLSHSDLSIQALSELIYACSGLTALCVDAHASRKPDTPLDAMFSALLRRPPPVMALLGRWFGVQPPASASAPLPMVDGWGLRRTAGDAAGGADGAGPSSSGGGIAALAGGGNSEAASSSCSSGAGTGALMHEGVPAVAPLAPPDLRVLKILGWSTTEADLEAIAGRLPQLREAVLELQGDLSARGCAALASLTGLEDLRVTGLAHLRPGGASPNAALAPLSRLTTLSFFNCELEDEDLGPLAALAGLDDLQFSHCLGIEGPGYRCLSACPKLQQLSVPMALEGQWEHLAALSQLKRLRVQVVGPLSVDCPSMPHVQHLSVMVFAPQPAGLWRKLLPALKSADIQQILAGEVVDDVTLGFYRHPTLEALSVENFEQGQPYMISEMASLPALAELFLCSNSRITAAELAALSSLTSLEYIGFQTMPSVTDSLIDALVRNNAKLEEIYLECIEGVSDAAIDAIIEHCASLKHVCLHGMTQLSDAAVARLRVKLPGDGVHVAEAGGGHDDMPCSSGGGGGMNGGGVGGGLHGGGMLEQVASGSEGDVGEGGSEASSSGGGEDTDSDDDSSSDGSSDAGPLLYELS